MGICIQILFRSTINHYKVIWKGHTKEVLVIYLSLKQAWQTLMLQLLRELINVTSLSYPSLSQSGTIEIEIMAYIWWAVILLIGWMVYNMWPYQIAAN